MISVLGNPGYAASKAGVRAMSRVMASELSPRGIRVNVVAPGAARTPIWNGAAPTADAFAALDKRISRSIPLGRLGEAEEVAKTVLFLASKDASNIQGAEIFIYGGATGAPAGAPIYRGAFQENYQSRQRDWTKNRIAVALSGALQTYFAKLRKCIEPLTRQARHLSAGRFRPVVRAVSSPSHFNEAARRRRFRQRRAVLVRYAA
jgi:hypothetical protein